MAHNRLKLVSQSVILKARLKYQDSEKNYLQGNVPVREKLSPCINIFEGNINLNKTLNYTSGYFVLGGRGIPIFLFIKRDSNFQSVLTGPGEKKV